MQSPYYVLVIGDDYEINKRELISLPGGKGYKEFDNAGFLAILYYKNGNLLSEDIRNQVKDKILYLLKQDNIKIYYINAYHSRKCSVDDILGEEIKWRDKKKITRRKEIRFSHQKGNQIYEILKDIVKCEDSKCFIENIELLINYPADYIQTYNNKKLKDLFSTLEHACGKADIFSSKREQIKETANELLSNEEIVKEIGKKLLEIIRNIAENPKQYSKETRDNCIIVLKFLAELWDEAT